MGEKDRPWAVGEQAVVVSHGISAGLTMRTVARVTKRFVELDDGSKWSFGKPYPQGDSWWSQAPYMRRPTPQDADAIERQEFRAKIRWRLKKIEAVKLDDVATEKLRDASASLWRAMKALEEGK